MLKKVIVAAAVTAGSLTAATVPAGASHDHFIQRTDNNGETHCRYIAEGQTSKDGGEPGGHKFHDNVHTGEPGGTQPNDRENGTDFNKTGTESDPYAYEDDCDHVYDKNDRDARRNPNYTP